uniref:Ribosomal protein S3 n=1 Tax=Cavenderia fasciculata TaxID=261658 RepID=B2XX96_CACFS|nr:ribosomal protein S3 [Cavenderia fasciculata]ABX45218.1 ribosomal protein S3 [Cavenderia fasciculata]
MIKFKKKNNSQYKYQKEKKQYKQRNDHNKYNKEANKVWNFKKYTKFKKKKLSKRILKRLKTFKKLNSKYKYHFMNEFSSLYKFKYFNKVRNKYGYSFRNSYINKYFYARKNYRKLKMLRKVTKSRLNLKQFYWQKKNNNKKTKVKYRYKPNKVIEIRNSVPKAQRKGGRYIPRKVARTRQGYIHYVVLRSLRYHKIKRLNNPKIYKKAKAFKYLPTRSFEAFNLLRLKKTKKRRLKRKLKQKKRLKKNKYDKKAIKKSRGYFYHFKKYIRHIKRKKRGLVRLPLRVKTEKGIKVVWLTQYKVAKISRKKQAKFRLFFKTRYNRTVLQKKLRKFRLKFFKRKRGFIPRFLLGFKLKKKYKYLKGLKQPYWFRKQFAGEAQAKKDTNLIKFLNISSNRSKGLSKKRLTRLKKVIRVVYNSLKVYLKKKYSKNKFSLGNRRRYGFPKLRGKRKWLIFKTVSKRARKTIKGLLRIQKQQKIKKSVLRGTKGIKMIKNFRKLKSIFFKELKINAGKLKKNQVKLLDLNKYNTIDNTLNVTHKILFKKFMTIYLEKLKKRLKFYALKTQIAKHHQRYHAKKVQTVYKKIKIKLQKVWKTKKLVGLNYAKLLALNTYYKKKYKVKGTFMTYLSPLDGFMNKKVFFKMMCRTKLHKKFSNLSYYFYYKRLRMDKIFFDKLNYKQGRLNVKMLEKKNSKKIIKVLLFLLCRTYMKSETRYINMKKALQLVYQIKKIANSKEKYLYSNLTNINQIQTLEDLGYYRGKYRKYNIGGFMNKKYMFYSHKKFIIKVLFDIILKVLKNSKLKNKKLYIKVIKKLIKYLYIPLVATSKIVQKKKYFKKKNKIYFFLSQVLLYNIKQIVQTKSYVINFFGMISENITAETLLRRLVQRMDIRRRKYIKIAIGMRRKLERSKNFLGFKVKFAGRLSPSIMASQTIIQKGIIGTGRLNVYLDYAQGSVMFKYGKCGIKVWLARNLYTYMPYKYVYSYKYNY